MGGLMPARRADASRRLLAAALLFAVLPLRTFAQTVTERRDAAWGEVARGASLRAGGHMPAALAAFREALALAPDLGEAAVELAVTYSWMGRIREAEASYRDALARDSTLLAARLGLARMSAWRGDLEPADSAFRALARLPEARLEALMGPAAVARASGDFDRARVLVAQVLAEAPTHGEAHTLQRQLQGEGRWQLQGQMGTGSRTPDAAGVVGLRYRVGARTDAAASYRWLVIPPQHTLATPEDLTWSQLVSVGIGRRLNTQLSAALTYETGLSSMGGTRSLALEVARRATDGLTLSAGVRPMQTAHERALLVWTSADKSLGRIVRAGLSAYRGMDSRGHVAMSLAPQLVLDGGQRGELRTWLVRGRADGRAFRESGITARVARTPRLAWTLTASRQEGTQDAVQVLIGAQLVR